MAMTLSTNNGATLGDTGQYTTTGSAAIGIPANSTRRSVCFVNSDATNSCYFGYSSGLTTSNGFPLVAGAGFTSTCIGPIYFIDGGSHVVVAFSEVYDG